MQIHLFLLLIMLYTCLDNNNVLTLQSCTILSKMQGNWLQMIFSKTSELQAFAQFCWHWWLTTSKERKHFSKMAASSMSRPIGFSNKIFLLIFSTWAYSCFETIHIFHAKLRSRTYHQEGIERRLWRKGSRWGPPFLNQLSKLWHLFACRTPARHQHEAFKMVHSTSPITRRLLDVSSQLFALLWCPTQSAVSDLFHLPFLQYDFKNSIQRYMNLICFSFLRVSSTARICTYLQKNELLNAQFFAQFYGIIVFTSATLSNRRVPSKSTRSPSVS